MILLDLVALIHLTAKVKTDNPSLKFYSNPIFSVATHYKIGYPSEESKLQGSIDMSSWSCERGKNDDQNTTTAVNIKDIPATIWGVDTVKARARFESLVLNLYNSYNQLVEINDAIPKSLQGCENHFLLLPCPDEGVFLDAELDNEFFELQVSTNLPIRLHKFFKIDEYVELQRNK